jgi:uncharacterized protein DUF3618
MSYTEQLERDTERTRLELANTIEELRDRLTPGEVLDEALDYASDGDVGAFLRNLRRQVVDNPLPAGLMGMGVAWLLVASAFGRGGNGATPGKRAARNGSDIAAGTRARASAVAESARATGADFVDSARATGAGLADSARATGADLAESARATGADLADSARSARDEIAGSTRRSVHDLGNRAAAVRADATNRAIEVVNEIGHSSRAASRAVLDFAHEQPLIIAAAGLVLGAIIGAVLPSTEIEASLIGESSDAAKERLRQAAGEQYAKAKEMAMRTAEAALDGNASGPLSDDGAAKPEFGPGPGYPADAAHASGEPSGEAEQAEHTHGGGG